MKRYPSRNRRIDFIGQTEYNAIRNAHDSLGEAIDFIEHLDSPALKEMIEELSKSLTTLDECFEFSKIPTTTALITIQDLEPHERLRLIRERSLMRQTDFAALLNVTQTTVSHWEKALTKPSEKMRIKIAKILGEAIFEQ